MKNKFFLILLIFFILILVFCVSSFASTELQFSNGEKYTFPDFSDKVQNKDYCIVYGNNENVGTYFILLVYDKEQNNPYLYNSSGNYSLKLFPTDKKVEYSNSIRYNYYFVRSNNASSWSYSSTSDASGFYFSGGIYGVYTTQDLKDTEGNVVFQPTPQLVGEVTIPEITQVGEIPQMMGKVLEMIIPIGLIIFGIGLLILLVRLVISRMT